MYDKDDNEKIIYPRQERWIKYITYTLFLLLIYLVTSTLQFVIKAESTYGKIVSVSKNWSCSEDSNGRRTCDWKYRPTFAFPDHLGKHHRVRSSVTTSNSSEYFQGKTVEVLYSKRKPYEAKLRKFFPIWGKEMILSIIVALFVALHLFFQRRTRKYFGQEGNVSYAEYCLRSAFFIPFLIIIMGIIV